MKLAPALLLSLAACAVAPRLDPATISALPAEERFTLGVGDSVVVVDHLRIETDSVRGRAISATGSAGGPEIAMVRDSSLEVRRAFDRGPGLELAMVPAILYLGMMLVFRLAMGSD